MCDWRGNLLKTIFQLMCQLLWVVGMVMAMSGVSLLMKYRHYSLFFSQTYILLPTVFTICSGAFLLFTGFLGTWLSLRHSRCLHGLFVYLLVVIFCLGSTASALAYVHSRKLDSDTASLSEVFQKYTGSSQDRNSRIVDVTQEQLHCCGVRNYTDWLDSSWLNKTGGDAVPHSCCNTTFLSCKGSLYQPWQLYHQGCQVKVEMAFQFILRFIMWTSLLGFLTEVVLLYMAAQMVTMEERLNYQALSNT
ncbi:tetraspanin 37 isoform X2 [Gambusia affinis]|uniref:tetraspanin 37 isoform X2 n=1 Tax=Gambusia affinis TaxID=33528 RepID=UPI001CDBD614|nr:tetraspanin 37 isoform X2 [Gambusia affinis]